MPTDWYIRSSSWTVTSRPEKVASMKLITSTGTAPGMWPLACIGRGDASRTSTSGDSRFFSSHWTSTRGPPSPFAATGSASRHPAMNAANQGFTIKYMVLLLLFSDWFAEAPHAHGGEDERGRERESDPEGRGGEELQRRELRELGDRILERARSERAPHRAHDPLPDEFAYVV